MTTAAVLLAAGAGARFAGPSHKLAAKFKGKPLIIHAVEAARQAGFDEIIVVGGSFDPSPLLGDDITVLINHDWADGQALSLQVAVWYARSQKHDAIVVGTGDQPLLGSEPWAAVRDEPGEIVTATFKGQRRPPVKLGAAVWDFLPLAGDEGARVLLQSRPDLVVELPCEGNPADIDTVEDLERWN